MNEHDKLAAAIKERDEARAEVKRLTKERNKAREEMRRLRNGWKRFSEIADLMHIERDQAREELQLLKQERDLWQQIQRDKATCKQSLQVRPEPSRLEIAAMIYAAFAGAQCNKEKVNPTAYVAVKCADELIAAAKEAK